MEKKSSENTNLTSLKNQHGTKSSYGYEKLGIDKETAKKIEEALVQNVNSPVENSVGFDKKGNIMDRNVGEKEKVLRSNNKGIHSHNHVNREIVPRTYQSYADIDNLSNNSGGYNKVKYDVISQGNERSIIKLDPIKAREWEKII